MVKTLKIEGQEYDVSTLSEAGRANLAQFQHVTAQLQEAQNLHAVLTKARHAYIADLKNEIVKGKSGIDLSALFDD
ncbi:valyl-tRNA synthetase [Roseobacter sp. AzwK-3b]|uniref:DUF6447 family protein n=1 Tax=Roseobacter sp. AzwK-3b TaxID=351016 RepID=UPI000156A07B|nr:DUF6447 family protein [Roseobacter sp. AzwK-3b]EDM70249.1 valyl-tRNA synthetase [Roseobacter sp. AzwK-3b]